jgi:hypothetical protein
LTTLSSLLGMTTSVSEKQRRKSAPPPDRIARIRYLSATIRHAASLYYCPDDEYGDSPLDDYTFDLLCEELETYTRLYPHYNSPTNPINQVGWGGPGFYSWRRANPDLVLKPLRYIPTPYALRDDH